MAYRAAAYRKKAAALSALIAVLFAAYVFSFALDPGRKRDSSFAWLDPSLLVLADRIEIAGPEGAVALSRVNNTWVVRTGAADLPVKQGRVGDFLAALSRKEAYALRAASPEAGERLGLTEARASRVTIRGGAGLPLLDLLIGAGGALREEVYLRLSGKREIYSGTDRFTLYVDSKPASWLDLRLFPALSDAAFVQQADITLPGAGKAFSLRRGGGGWILLGDESGAAADALKTEAWLRAVLLAEAGDFGSGPPAAAEGSVTLRLGDGTSAALFAGPAFDSYRSVTVSGSGLSYILPERTLNRLFRDSSYFMK